MAIPCDIHDPDPETGEVHAADVIVTFVSDGTVTGACAPGFLELCQRTLADAEANAPAPEPPSPEAETEAEVQATDTQAIELLDSGHDHPAEPTRSPKVVKRGTSRSRRAYQARQRAKAAEPDVDTAPEASGAPEGSTGPTGDAGG